MNKFIIREFIPEQSKNDFELLFPVFLSIWNEPDNLKFLSFTQMPFDEETVKSWFSNHLSQGRHYYAAINEDNEIAGILNLIINPFERFVISGIAVHSEFRRQGVGGHLVDSAVKLAVNLGYKSVDVAVFADNKSMLRLLLSKSFIPVSMDYNRRSDGADLVRLKIFF